MEKICKIYIVKIIKSITRRRESKNGDYDDDYLITSAVE